MQNLTIIGTSHIARESLTEVREELTKDYDILALELDKQRLYALLHKTKSTVRASDILRVGIKGYVFSLIGAWAEKKLGNIVGVRPGAEMLAAYRLATKKHMRVALIDQRIDITLKRFSKALTWKEKWNFLVDILKGIFVRKPEITFDLTKVPSKELIKKLISKVKKRYPNFYRVLVTERNQLMARNIATLIRNYQDKKILAIVGAGHEDELSKLVKENLAVDVSYSVSIG